MAGQDPAKVLSSDGLIVDLKKALAERVLQAGKVCLFSYWSSLLRAQRNSGAADLTSEGAKFSFQVMNELKDRGAQHKGIAAVDRFKGFSGGHQ